MSQRYASIARDRLAADPVITEWAAGGVIDHDPRRSGSGSTSTFETDGSNDIRPTIACVPGNATRSIGGPENAIEHTVLVRLFAPDHAAFRAGMDDMAARIIALLFRYQPGGDDLGIFRWSSRLGITGGGDFEDVLIDEVRFAVVGLHKGVTV